MSITFRAVGRDEFPLPGAEVNFANTNAFAVLRLFGIEPEYCGSVPVRTILRAAPEAMRAEPHMMRRAAYLVEVATAWNVDSEKGERVEAETIYWS